MKIVQSKRIFLNSEQAPANSESRDMLVNIPQGVISCAPHQQIRVTLGSFVMRQNFYLINKYNNVFYVVAKSSTDDIISGKIVIPQGNYQSFTDSKHGLCAVLKKAIDDVITIAPFNCTGATVEWDLVTGLLRIEVDTTGATANAVQNMKLVTFTIRDYNQGGGSVVQDVIGNDSLGCFQDAFEIMGGCNHTRNVVDGTTAQQYDSLKNMFSVTPSGNTGANPATFVFQGHFQASLATKENVYLRTNIQSTNVQSAGFDTGSSAFPYILNSRILAKIPINNPYTLYTACTDADDKVTRCEYESPYHLIKYQDDGSGLYSMLLTTKEITTMRLTLTDAYGRLLPEESAEQISCNALYWTGSLIVDVLEDEGGCTCSSRK